MTTRYFSIDLGGTVPSQVTEGSSTQITELAAPTADTFVLADAGGTLLDSTTYSYRVSAVDADGESLANAAVTQATGTGGNPDEHTITVKWLAVSGATSYKVYGRTAGSEQYLATVAAPTVQYLDDGSATPSGAVPTENTTNAKDIEYRVVYDATGASKIVALKALEAIKNKINTATVPVVHTFYSVAVAGDMPLDVTVGTSTGSSTFELEVDWSASTANRLRVLNAIDAIAGYITRDTWPPA